VLRKVKFCGQPVSPEDLELIREVVETCSGLSRMELARTVCDLLEWERVNGALKARECREFLEGLEARGFLRLPAARKGRPIGSVTRVPETDQGAPQDPIVGTVRDVKPVRMDLVEDSASRLLWRELVGRYHYLGHKVPFGAHLRYVFYISHPARDTLAGCIQVSSPGWHMAARDRWIGWDHETRIRNLQQIINNSRFMILPWVQVRNLASTLLALAARQVPDDWERRYGIRPVLMESLVDPSRYAATCYRAANWLELGTTTGRGREDRDRTRTTLAPKRVLVYPLVPDARERLCASEPELAAAAETG
jgi:hypothetical protein